MESLLFFKIKTDASKTNYGEPTSLLRLSDIRDLCIVIKIRQCFVLGNETAVFRMTFNSRCKSEKVARYESE